MTLDIKEFSRRVRVLDGAWGTEFQKRGLPAGACPELWNTDNVEAVLAVARSYVEAGSEVILTNTFGGNRFVLAAHGAGERAAELCEVGAAISRRAAGSDVKVFGSIGPTGKIVMMDEVPPAELKAAFAESAAGIERGGADAIVLETFNELAELRLALEAAKEATSLAVVASMTFASGPNGTATMMGESPADLVAAAEAGGASAVGANCGVGPDNYVKVAAMLSEATALPVWIKANAGLPLVDSSGNTTFPMGPAQFADCVAKLVEAGANFIGGCCGTTPEHIRAIRAAVNEQG